MMIRRSPPLILLATVLTLWLGGRMIVAWPQPLAEAGKEPGLLIPVTLASRALAKASPPERYVVDDVGRDIRPASDAALPQSVGRPRRALLVAAAGGAISPPIRGQTTAAPAKTSVPGHYARLQSLILASYLSPPASPQGVAYRTDGGRAWRLPTLHRRPPPLPGRWSGVAWIALRDAGTAEGLSNSPRTVLLGGSQAGGRIGFTIDQRRRIEGYARLVSTGRHMDGAEGALGVAWQPLPSLPVRLAVERRQRIAGEDSRSAMAAMAIGGVSDLPLPQGWRLDGYGAAGVVGARHQDAFAEGSAHVMRPFGRFGRVTVTGGGAVWGAAQPGAARLDAGPTLSARIDNVASRLTLDWRQRMAGNAAPASGVAITLASDF